MIGANCYGFSDDEWRRVTAYALAGGLTTADVIKAATLVIVDAAIAAGERAAAATAATSGDGAK